MKKLSLSRSLRRNARGATVVEHALILVLVMVVASPRIAPLGHLVAARFQATVASFTQ
jgi:Flp pilus assembly pilin Flp